ncbi:signal peptidase I [Gemmatimonadota bacterium]
MKNNHPVNKETGSATLVEWLRSLGLTFALFFLLLRPFVVQAYHVPTGSMEGTILIGDFLLVNKLAYGGISPHKVPFTDFELPCFHMPGYDSPGKGDIVVFKPPVDSPADYVKRCVAVGGDTVEMRDKVLYINHQPQDETYLRHADPQVRGRVNRLYGVGHFSWQYDYLIDEKKKEPGGFYSPTRDNFGPLVVPEGKYFCLGDNRDVSSDSRFWGFVDRELIKGRPMLIHFSWDKKGRLPRFDRIGRIIQ